MINIYKDFKRKINLEILKSRFKIKTIENAEELKEAFKLRYQVFQVEMVGHATEDKEDFDDYDLNADHLAIYDVKTNSMIATCRLNHSQYCKSFYSEQEFNIKPLIECEKPKLEIGRVCIKPEFRNGIVLILLWRALAQYIQLANVKILFGCGSVMTEEPKSAALIYKYLIEENKAVHNLEYSPTKKYSSEEFSKYFSSDRSKKLTAEERAAASSLIPSLCRSYFEMGCYVPCAPAFDKDFKCIDFLTILDIENLDMQLKAKMFGSDKRENTELSN